MCGIVGVASAADTVPVELLVRMRDTLRHRGPDDAGVWRSPDNQVGLAHQRLAVIDLSPAGHQPMADASGCAQIVFNGEIYNFDSVRRRLVGAGHRFRSASDTEVILAAYRQWGTDCLRELNGMFAFAIYDPTRRRMFLARDRAGEKPLFYRHAGGRLVFASELKALMTDPSTPRVLDPDAVDEYLALGYVAGDRSMLRGIHKLPPAHALTFDLDHDCLKVWRYWDLPEPDIDAGASAEDLVTELGALLRDAVARQLVADVPVGILLSGGLDSGLVTAFAAASSAQPVKTFTIAFPGHGGHDESAHARLVARHFGTEHLELEAEPASVELLPMLARQYDEPIGDSSMVPTFLVCRLVRQHATVALGGDGGDELFGGYPWYSAALRMQAWRRRVPQTVRSLIAGAAARALPVGRYGRRTLLRLGARGPGPLDRLMLFDSWTRGKLLRHRARASRDQSDGDGRRCGSPLRLAQIGDFTTYLPEDILVKVDRASMLSSLEVRAPWLDSRIIEFAFRRVPDHLKATESEGKILLRLLGARVLPRELDLRRKQGFSIPIETWFQGRWGDYLVSVLRQADPDLFDPTAIARLVAHQRRGRTTNADRLFAIAMFELWRREYRVETAA